MYMYRNNVKWKLDLHTCKCKVVNNCLLLAAGFFSVFTGSVNMCCMVYCDPQNFLICYDDL